MKDLIFLYLVKFRERIACTIMIFRVHQPNPALVGQIGYGGWLITLLSSRVDQYIENKSARFLIASETRDPCNLFLMTITIWSNMLEIAQFCPCHQFLSFISHFLPNTCQYLPNTCQMIAKCLSNACQTCKLLAYYFLSISHDCHTFTLLANYLLKYLFIP